MRIFEMKSTLEVGDEMVETFLADRMKEV